MYLDACGGGVDAATLVAALGADKPHAHAHNTLQVTRPPHRG